VIAFTFFAVLTYRVCRLGQSCCNSCMGIDQYELGEE